MLSSIYEWVNPIFWPAPGAVWDKLVTISSEGYRNFTLWEHIGWSLYRILMGFGLGCLVGIPLGFAMGLSRIMRGMFDPIVEFFRPIPPLAFIPLVIIWSGDRRALQDPAALPRRAVDHGHRRPRGRVQRQALQDPRRLHPRRQPTAGSSSA